MKPQLQLETLGAVLPSSGWFRSYGCAISATPGVVLMLPLPACAGDLRALVDGCPVPWVEALEIAEASATTPADPADPGYSDLVHRLGQLDGQAWAVVALPALRALVWVHALTGLRVAIAMDMAFAGGEEAEVLYA